MRFNCNIEITDKEKQGYIEFIQNKEHNKEIEYINVVIDDEGYANIEYKVNPIPFERIRRITGYLVGTLDRFNDAKYAEVQDRVKHSIGTGSGEMEQL